MECDWTFLWLPLHVHFRWGVALIEEFSTRHCLPRRGEIFSGTGGTLGEDTDPRTQL